MFDFIPGKKVLDLVMPDEKDPDGKGTDKPGLVDKVRAGWRALMKTPILDMKVSWTDKLAVLTGTYRKELAKIQDEKDGVTAETEDELAKAAEATEGSQGEFENAIMQPKCYQHEQLSDIEEKRKDNEAFDALEEAVAKNFGDKDNKIEDPDLKAALEKMKNQPDKEPEDSSHALDAKQAMAFSAATLNTWLDLEYDKDGNRISPEEFSELIHRLWKQSGRAKDLVKTFFHKNFEYAFKKMEQAAKLDVMSKFGVEAGFSDLMGSGQASQIRDALVVVGTKENGGSDREEIEGAARILQPVFFPRTKVDVLMDVLENVNDMISGDEARTPDLVAETFYNINPKDLREIVHKFNNVRTKWGVHKSKGGAANDDEEIEEAKTGTDE